jgi:hypothetical protein
VYSLGDLPAAFLVFTSAVVLLTIAWNLDRSHAVVADVASAFVGAAVCVTAVGCIYLGFGLDAAFEVEGYRIGNTVRPWAKAVGGVSSLASAGYGISVMRWVKQYRRSIKQ